MSLKLLLKDFYHHTGINFSETEHIVDKKIQNFYTQKGFKDYNDFFSSLKKDTELYQELINLLTTSETYFYREFAQIDFCISLIKNLSHTVKILCAPCASGEEAYSILIAMLEADINLSKIEIYAIDINSSEIQKAQKGIYIQRRLHKLSKSIQDKYFLPLAQDNFQIKPSLQKHIHFKQMNIFKPFEPNLKNFDVIFSRNMLIYFDDISQKHVEKIFYDKLIRGGVLFLGHADKIHEVTSFTIKKHNGIHYYKKY
ncbi:protein-glutamate O-methyltransferase CheR [Sulfurimonas sp. MAG313]|nr:protein-glutamate O-methyltransferase CheR [Sulfurimonas sp. MAG313]MDF1881042.1 protein-glutamate O-methyltransferase CheR [Sulfurimonas sp. MAG313]